MRGERHVESVKKRYELIMDIGANPEAYLTDHKWAEMLNTIASMCAFDEPSMGIRKCAKNTLKRVAATSLLGGFLELEKRRQESKSTLADALKSQSKKSSRKPNSVRNLLANISSYQSDVQKLEATLAQMLVVVDELRDLAFHLSHRENIVDRKRYWEKRIRDINLIFQLVGRNK